MHTLCLCVFCVCLVSVLCFCVCLDHNAHCRHAVAAKVHKKPDPCQMLSLSLPVFVFVLYYSCICLVLFLYLSCVFVSVWTTMHTAGMQSPQKSTRSPTHVKCSVSPRKTAIWANLSLASMLCEYLFYAFGGCSLFVGGFNGSVVKW